MAAEPLLSVSNLSVEIRSRRGLVCAVSDVSFSVQPGEFVGIAGESGCGKSTLCHAISRSLPPAATLKGSIRLDGEEIATKSESQMRGIRGRKMSMILQNPLTSLDPVFKIGAQIDEVLRHVVGLSGEERRRRMLQLLEQVHISDPERRARSYPHQLSGGMRQRVMIAMASAPRPMLHLADEPTTALDVTIQEQILGLFREIRDLTGCTFIIVTHDLGIIRRLCDRVLVMYGGRLVEESRAAEAFAHPRHPYTAALVGSLPRIGDRRRRLQTIEGGTPDLAKAIEGCAFAPRCAFAIERCAAERPLLTGEKGGRAVACHLFDAAALPVVAAPALSQVRL